MICKNDGIQVDPQYIVPTAKQGLRSSRVASRGSTASAASGRRHYCERVGWRYHGLRIELEPEYPKYCVQEVVY